MSSLQEMKIATDGQNRPKTPIYLDYQATTPTDPRVVEAMLPYFTTHFGNPHSRNHSYGWEAEKAVENARAEVAKLVNCDPKEIVWTSGATESDNLAIKGAAYFYKTKGKHLVTMKTEHKAVLDTMRELERQGFEVTYLDPQPDGLIDLEAFKAALRPDIGPAIAAGCASVVKPAQQTPLSMLALAEILREVGLPFQE